MRRYCVLLMILLQPCLYASDELDSKSFFHQFAVGQGNCQLFIYPLQDGSTLGFMYDAGSADGTLHKKFIQLRKNEVDIIFSDKRAGNSGQLSAMLPPLPSDDESDTSHSDGSHSSGIRSVGEGLEKETIGAQHKKEIRGVLEGLVATRGLTHLVIFLSHPDSDHINYLRLHQDSSENILPDNLRVHIILSGDWLGDAGANEVGSDLKWPVCEVLKLVVNRPNTTFSMPYYWGESDYTRIVQQIREGLRLAQTAISTKKRGKDHATVRENITIELYRRFKSHPFRPRYSTTDPFFHGNFGELVSVMESKADLPQNYFSMQNGEYGSPFELVKIWSLNHRADDPNDQSAVVSFTFLGKPHMSFVSTGDARDGAFARIRDVGQNALRQWKGLDDDHIVFCMLPHHGSDENISFHLWDIFRPNAFIIPAGTYTRHGHPVHNLISIMLDRTTSGYQLMNKFRERFHITDLSLRPWFVTFQSKQEGAKTVKTAKQVDMYDSAILCPNVQGTISIEENRSAVTMTSHPSVMVLVRGGRDFSIDYRKRYKTIGKDGVTITQDQQIKIGPQTYSLIADDAFEDMFQLNVSGASGESSIPEFLWRLNDSILYQAKMEMAS